MGKRRGDEEGGREKGKIVYFLLLKMTDDQCVCPMFSVLFEFSINDATPRCAAIF